MDGKPGLDEIFAYGLRNPYAFSFDKLTNQLYVGDVGQNTIEKIDLVTRGGNYGWRYKEGSLLLRSEWRRRWIRYDGPGGSLAARSDQSHCPI